VKTVFMDEHQATVTRRESPRGYREAPLSELRAGEGMNANTMRMIDGFAGRQVSANWINER
jgi:hypothetical protein